MRCERKSPGGTGWWMLSPERCVGLYTCLGTTLLAPCTSGGTRPVLGCPVSARPPAPLGPRGHSALYTPSFPVSTRPSTSQVPQEHSAVYTPSTRQVLGPLYSQFPSSTARLHSRSPTSLRFTVSGSEHRSRCV